MTRDDFDALLDLLFGSLIDVMSGTTIEAGLWRVAALTLMVLAVTGLAAVSGTSRQVRRGDGEAGEVEHARN